MNHSDRFGKELLVSFIFLSFLPDVEQTDHDIAASVSVCCD